MIISCKCGSRFKIKDELVTDRPKRAKCRSCGEPIIIVRPAEPATAAAELTPAKPAPAEPTTAAEVSPAEPAAAGEAPAEKGETPIDPHDQDAIEAKLEKRRQAMEDEISGRLNKAALETLDLDALKEIAEKLNAIDNNSEYQADKGSQLFSCIQCNTVFAVYPDDSRHCADCGGEVALVRGEDILRQYGMFNR